MKRSQFFSGSLSMLTILCIALSATAANIPAVTITGGEARVGHSQNSSHTMGWAFSTASDINVTMLGWYDHEQDGLIEPHSVGIFDDTGTLLVSAEIPAGTSAALNAQFRYVEIAPYLLPAGHDYVIGGTYGEVGTDVHVFQVTDRQAVPQITIPPGAARYTESGSFTELTYPPLSFLNYNAYMGPNFQIQAVPEPSGVVLMACSLVVFTSLARRNPNAVQQRWGEGLR